MIPEHLLHLMRHCLAHPEDSGAAAYLADELTVLSVEGDGYVPRAVLAERLRRLASGREIAVPLAVQEEVRELLEKPPAWFCLFDPARMTAEERQHAIETARSILGTVMPPSLDDARSRVLAVYPAAAVRGMQFGGYQVWSGPEGDEHALPITLHRLITPVDAWEAAGAAISARPPLEDATEEADLHRRARVTAERMAAEEVDQE